MDDGDRAWSLMGDGCTADGSLFLVTGALYMGECWVTMTIGGGDGTGVVLVQTLHRSVTH